MTETKVFLAALTRELPDDHQIGIWSLPGYEGQWFADPDPALSYIIQIDQQTRDVYVHVGIAPPGYAKPRAEGADLIGRLGFVADLDLNHDRTQELLDRCDAPPTLLVGSGHGYHAWWLFEEPVIYDGPEATYDRAEVESIAHDWIRSLRVHAHDLGITEKLDGVHDLARILRVPGTQNNKHAVKMPVQLLLSDGPRYCPDEIYSRLLDEDRLLTEPIAETAAVGELLLRADAVPPNDKFAALMTNHELFQATWKHERDNELPDPSPSGYDLALANVAAAAGWSEQEITNLLIAHRRLHNADLKLRQDYYTRTIGKALAHRRQERIMEGERPESPDDREDGLAHLRELLDVPLTDIKYLDGQEPVYRFDFGERGLVQMAAELVRSRQVWDRKVFAATRLPPRTPIGKGADEAWRSVCKAFGALAEHVVVGIEASIDQETKAILEAYLQRWPVEHVRPGEPVPDDEAPFYRDGKLWVRADQVRQFARQMMDIRLSRSELMQRFRLLGAESKTIHVRFTDGTTTTRAFWGIALELVEN